MKAALPAKPFSLLIWLALPAAALLALALDPPHALDAAIARLFWAQGSFPMQHEASLLLIHRYAALVPGAIAILALARLVQLRLSGADPAARAESGRLAYLLLAMLSCVATVWWLKSTTGVYCPWSIEGFGGTRPLSSPSLSLAFQSGKCWPGGFAGTGFCLFSLFFAFRDRHPVLARAGLALALAFGGFCSAVQMIRGAHFLSHNAATLCIDWLICAFAYCALFARAEFARRLVTAGAVLALLLRRLGFSKVAHSKAG